MDSSEFLSDMIMLIGGLAVATILITVLLVWFFRFMGRTNRVEKLQPGEGHPGRRPQCHICGRKMEPGYTMAPRGLIWRNRDDKPSTIAPVWSSMENTVNMGFTAAENISWRCRECMVLVMDHSRLVIRKKK